MNKQRRKQLNELSGKIEELREKLEALHDEEQDYYNNMPKNFQDGEKGEAAQNAIRSSMLVYGEMEKVRCTTLTHSISNRKSVASRVRVPHSGGHASAG